MSKSRRNFAFVAALEKIECALVLSTHLARNDIKEASSVSTERSNAFAAPVLCSAVIVDTLLVLTEYQNGDCLTLAKAARLLNVNASTIFRWVTKGSRKPDGSRVKLEACRLGAKWVTSRQAATRFVAALTTINTDSTEEIRTPVERNKASEKAAAKLREMGA